MQMFFRRGYIVYRERGERDFTYVAPHSGPALEIPTSRDDNSETVASLCWMRTGGTLIISTMPRKRAFGIDFNRGIPKKGESLELFSDFLEDRHPARLHSFRNRYAWSAYSDEDHRKRRKVYQSFWNEVKSGQTIALIHSAFNRLKLVPSIMDVSTFDSRGVNRKLLKEVVEDINDEYRGFFNKIDRAYKAVVLLEEERAINNMIRVSETFGLDSMNPGFLENIRADLDAIRAYTGSDVMKRLEGDFTPASFLKAARKALMNMEPPRVTIEHFFRGAKSVAPKKQLLARNRAGRVVINFECSRFINFWYPHQAADIITKTLEMICSMQGD
jgi:hypothetical protein